MKTVQPDSKQPTYFIICILGETQFSSCILHLGNQRLLYSWGTPLTNMKNRAKANKEKWDEKQGKKYTQDYAEGRKL